MAEALEKGKAEAAKKRKGIGKTRAATKKGEAIMSNV